MFEAILRDLSQPEYVHVLLNSLPVYGLAVGLIGLLVAICIRSRHATVVALVVIFISTAAAWPVYEYGEQGYDRVLAMADRDGQAWLVSHKERAEDLIWLFYAVAILSGIALTLPVKWPGSSAWLAVAVLVLGAITLGAGGYIAYAGGRVRHREFRNEPAPTKVPKAKAQPTAPAARPAGSIAPATVKVFPVAPALPAAPVAPTSARLQPSGSVLGGAAGLTVIAIDAEVVVAAALSVATALSE